MNPFNHKILFTLTMLLIVPVAHAYDFIVDGLAYNINPDGTTVTLTYLNPPANPGTYNNLSGAISIPDNVINNGISYPVTAIGGSTFYCCRDITSVTIPNSVTCIGDYAFHHCDSMTSIIIPNSVTTIGIQAFDGCGSLTEITIPNSLTSISYCMLYNCSAISSVTIPSSVTSIDSFAFRGCSSLVEVNIPNTVTSIGYNAFYNTPWLSNKPDGLIYAGQVAYKFKGNMAAGTSISIQEGIKEISPHCFEGCSGLTEITIPYSVISIGADAFQGCTGLTSFTIPSTINAISDGLFWGCSNLSSVSIPSSITSIGVTAFYNCSNLDKITIPNTVTSIGSAAFEGCSKLDNLVIPNSVYYIGSNAFHNTTWFNNQPDGLLYAGLVAYKYKGEMPNSSNIIIKKGTKGIAGTCFSGCSWLTSFTIPSSVTSIGEYPFYGCENLNNIFSYVNPAETTLKGVAVFGGVDKSACTLHVPKGQINAYRAADQWKDFINIVDDLEIEMIIGDLNADGEISIADVTSLVDVVLRQESTGASDVNGDGETSVADITALVYLLLNKQ